jgi:hypothetical protein
MNLVRFRCSGRFLESCFAVKHTVKGKDLVVAGDTRVGDNIVDPARGRDIGRCFEEPDLVVPVGDITLYISGPDTVSIYYRGPGLLVQLTT